MSESKEIWYPNSPGFEYPEAVLTVKEQMNMQGLEGVMNSTPILVDRHENGIGFTVNGTAGSSTVEGALLYLAFANKRTQHNRVKAEFLRRTLEATGVRDAKGDPLPVITVDSPSLGSTINMDKVQKDRTKAGLFYDAVKPSLDIAKGLGFGKLAIGGHSQGGTFTVFAAGEAHWSDLDVISTAASDMPGTKKFDKKAGLLDAFTADADYLSEEVVNAGLEPYIEALGYDKRIGFIQRRRQDAKFLMDVFAHPITNNALFTGLTKDSFERSLKHSMYSSVGAYHLIGYGTEDEIVAESNVIEEAVQAARDYVVPTPNIGLVEIAEGRHTWSDNVPLYATFYSTSVLRAKAA